LALMRLLDEQYTRTPFYGIRRMTAWLQQQGHTVNHKRVARLVRLMGLEAIYPKPRLSQPGRVSQCYPYLLRNLPIVRPNQVWSSDITYVRMRRGFLYLVAILVTCSPGNSPILWIRLSASRHWTAPYVRDSRTSSIVTKAHSLPVTCSPRASRPLGYTSAGMDAGVHWIMSSSSGSGAQ
jgi:HTH-like domain